jgi:hypothetical protein
MNVTPTPVVPSANRIEPPVRRPLKIYAFDPMLGRAPFSTLTVEIANEPLRPGPAGARIRVVDYDGGSRCFYVPVDLDDPAILMQGGLEPTESDPRFHQQMVYAVASKVLENFDRALGRRITFAGGRPLTLFPHAFRGPNAFYDPDARAIRFGYFAADRSSPGANLPGQNVYTCLSHDVIAHEMTHAIVDRLRHFFLEPSNRDVLAFHEGFSDIVSIFQHFSFRGVLRDTIATTRGHLRSPTPLVELASQFGHATGGGQALRSALDESGQPDPRLYDTVFEPHERGSILVAAVFDAFFTTYQARIADLLRIATGGTGQLPEGDLHPDLVTRIAGEAALAAQNILNMCIRAFEYLPPVDITFGDYLRALITADYDLVADSGRAQRRAMIEAFRLRGIYPEGVVSLAEDSLLWPRPEQPLEPLPEQVVAAILRRQTQTFRRRHPALEAVGEGEETLREEASRKYEAASDVDPRREGAKAFHAWSLRNHVALDLDSDEAIAVDSFHSTFRVAPDGQLQVEIVAQFRQADDSRKDEFGGLPARGGTTVIAAADGTVRYVISKPLPSRVLSSDKAQLAAGRLAAQRDYLDVWDRDDALLPWADERYERTRMSRRDFRALHMAIPR